MPEEAPIEPGIPAHEDFELTSPRALFDYLSNKHMQAYVGEDVDTSGITKILRPKENGRLYRYSAIPGVEGHKELESSIRIILRPPFTPVLRAEDDSFAESYAVFLATPDEEEDFNNAEESFEDQASSTLSDEDLLRLLGVEVNDQDRGEVSAVEEQDSEEFVSPMPEQASQYLVRVCHKGKYTAFELVTTEGAYPVNLSVFDRITGFGVLPELEAGIGQKDGLSKVVPERIGGEDIFASLKRVMNDSVTPIRRATKLYNIFSSYNTVPVADAD